MDKFSEIVISVLREAVWTDKDRKRIKKQQ